MPSTEFSTIINLPVSEVFAYAVDIMRLKEWNDVIEDSWLTTGSNSEVGTRYLVKAKVMGRSMEIPSEVVEYEQDHLYSYQSFGSMPYTSQKRFEKIEQGTRLTERIVMEPDGSFSRLMAPIMMAISKRSHVKNMQNLKRILENQ